VSWDLTRRTATVACHPLMAPVLQSVFHEIHRRDLWHLLEDYGGCFNFRNARGLSKLSTHCWGIAIDINVRTNGLGMKPWLDERIVAIFKDHGFIWGGDWTRKDGMHFQYCSAY
jgi:hypothetical protein